MLKVVQAGLCGILFWQLSLQPVLAIISIEPWKPLFKGIEHTTGSADVSETRLQKVFALRVDLRDPDIEFFSTPANGTADKETFGQTTTTFVSTYGVSVGVNANFFSPVSTIPNEPRELSGLAISRGRVVSPAESRPMLLISRSNTVTLTSSAPAVPSAWWTAVAGSDLVVQQGINRASVTCTSAFCGPNPRTAVGISQDRRYLYMLVIDGRQPGWSDGATLVETGNWLLRFGAWDGLNLDGGGSTAMVRQTNGIGVLLNKPSGGVQRVNGNHLGVFSTRRCVLARGDNFSRQLGVPEEATNLVALAAGASHGLALRRDGRVITWGANDKGQSSVPAGAWNVQAIAAGESHSLAISAGGRVIAWGDNSYGQCNIPSDLADVIGIAAGARHSVAVERNGRVRAWGDNRSGQTVVPRVATNIIAVAAGMTHTLAVDSSGKVFAWGGNLDASNTWAGQAVVPANLTNAIAVAAGGWHSITVLNNGSVVAWGDNSAGQCGVPPGLSSIAAVAAGMDYSMALTQDGRVLAWGDNALGQCSFPATSTNIILIAAGASHALAALKEGTPGPTLLRPAVDGRCFSVLTPSLPRTRYQLLRRADGASAWSSVASCSGNSGLLLLQDSAATNEHALYRLSTTQ